VFEGVVLGESFTTLVLGLSVTNLGAVVVLGPLHRPVVHVSTLEQAAEQLFLYGLPSEPHTGTCSCENSLQRLLFHKCLILAQEE
jgi:hypothetical protein